MESNKHDNYILRWGVALLYSQQNFYENADSPNLTTDGA